MIRILFICHGNICRSPMAKYVMQDLVDRRGLSGRFYIDSAAATYEEIGNPVYPPARRKLAEHGISCNGHAARHMTIEDYDKFDLIIGMDEENMWDLKRFYRNDPGHKFHLLMEYAGRPGQAVADPWYTRDFEATWQDVTAGCTGLLDRLIHDNPLYGRND